MKTWIRSLMSSRTGIMLQFLIPLVLLTGLVFGLMAITGCGGCNTTTSPQSHEKSGDNASYQCTMRGDGAHQPGQKTYRTFTGQSLTGSGSDQITYLYTPPPGSTSFVWDPDHLPQNPNGPPPYIFPDVPRGTEVHISFNLPALPPGYSAESFTEVIQSANGDYTWSSAAMRTEIRKGSLHQSEADTPLPAVPAGNRAPRQDDQLWEVGRWVDVTGITLTTELCNDWLSVLQSDDAFLAARLPIAPPAQPTQSYTIPLAFGGPNSATIELLEDMQTVFSLPLELRPERLTFADNELPAADGEAYIALGVSPVPTSCPSGLDLPASGWSLFASAWLDLHEQPDNCAGCILPTYYCYEGQELPPPLEAMAPGGLLAHTLTGVTGLTAYQAEGITCLGPHYVTLATDHEWELGGASSGWFTPTAPISFPHYLLASGTMTFSLELQSALGDGAFGLYEGDWQGPTLPLVEISNPVRVDGFRDIWLIADPPAPPPAGQYTLLITATRQDEPADQQVTSDLFWIGEWIAPALPTSGYDLYLPIVLRAYPSNP